MVLHTSFAEAQRYRGVCSTFSQLLLTLRRAFASAFLLFMTCFWLAFLFMLLFVFCFIVCSFCCTPPTICSVNSVVVSKFDAANVICFSAIKSSSLLYNGSSQIGTIPLFFQGYKSAKLCARWAISLRIDTGEIISNPAPICNTRP